MIELCAWDEARPMLAETLDGGADRIEWEVGEGLAHPWRLHGGTAYMLTRLEQRDTGPELVIIAAKGRGLAAAMPEMQRRAARQGIASMRFHTARGDGLGRLAGRYGFTEAERVYRVTFDGQ